MAIEVRPYAEADREAVWSLIDAVWADVGVGSGAAGHADLADIVGSYRRGGGEFWVATADARVVGTAALMPIGDGGFTLKRMYVLAPFRGRDGAAGVLLSAAIGYARSLGGRTVYLGTVEEAIASHRFYEKNGFARIAPGALPPGFFRSPEDTRFYALALDGAAISAI